MTKKKTIKLLNQPMHILNIGLEAFAQDLRQQEAEVLHMDWSPPAGGDEDMADLLSKLGC